MDIRLCTAAIDWSRKHLLHLQGAKQRKKRRAAKAVGTNSHCFGGVRLNNAIFTGSKAAWIQERMSHFTRLVADTQEILAVCDPKTII